MCDIAQILCSPEGLVPSYLCLLGKRHNENSTNKKSVQIYILERPQIIVNHSAVHVYLLKGLVHPKMKIKSLITHPHAVPTP